MYDYECLANFVHQRVEIGRQDNFLGIDNDINSGSRAGACQADCLAQATLDAIALNGASQGATYGEPDTQSRAAPLSLPLRKKNRHRSREVPLALLINALEIGVAQKPARARVGPALRWLDTWIRFIRHTGGHSASKI